MTVADLLAYPELRDAKLLNELAVHVDDAYLATSEEDCGRITAIDGDTVTLLWTYEDRYGYVYGDNSTDYPASDVTVIDVEDAQQWINDVIADRAYDASLVAS